MSGLLGGPRPVSAEAESGREVRCPFCGSGDVRLQQEKGVALCRSTFYCDGCYQPFEEFG